MKYYITALFLLSGLLFPANSVAQVLYENYNNIVTINVPGIDASKLIATAKGGTLVHKKGTQWIARPTGEKDASGVKKDFIITVSINRNGKKELLSTKAYEVKKAYIIDYYDKTTHHLKKDELKECDEVLLRADGIEKICFYINDPEVMGSLPTPNCDFRFSDTQKKYLTFSTRPLNLIITEAWNTSGQKIRLAPTGLFYSGQYRTTLSKYQSQTFIDGIYYEFSKTTAKVTEVAYDSLYYAGNVIIPSRVIHDGKEYKVTGIDSRAFKGCSGLTSITLPNSLTSIGFEAFSGCSGLTSMAIPDNVMTIQASAFSGCSSLTSITIPKGVTSIENYTFHGCSKLRSLTIPESVTSIGTYVFVDCANLTSITLPKNLTTIATCAFSGCTGLTSITIPEGVTSIEWCTFSGCSNLTSIIIPTSVISIETIAFKNCTSLTSIIIPESVTSIVGSAFSGCTGLLNIICFGEIPAKIFRPFFDNSIYNQVTLSYPAASAKLYDEHPDWGKFTNRNPLPMDIFFKN